MRGRSLLITLYAAIALSGLNAVVVGLYIYFSAAIAADIDQPLAISRLAADGLLPEAQWNERLERDGRSYRLKVTSDGTTGAGAVGITRDYLLLPRFDRLLASARISVLLSLLAVILLAAATWSASKSRQAQETHKRFHLPPRDEA